jgi:RNA polymerase sigma-70 factor (ECF subfamily)
MRIAADHALPRAAAPAPAPAPATIAAPARRLDPNHLGDHLDRLYRAAWALCGSREDAEDLVQETYARVLQKPRMIRSEEDLGYLLRVLRNTHFSRLRAAARRPRPEPFADDDIDRLEDPGGNGPEAALDASELYALIAALPDPFRDALVAIDVVGLSYREAARALRVREATVTTRLYRARQRLAHALGTERAG